MREKIVILLTGLFLVATISFATPVVAQTPQEAKSDHVVVIVVDGLRPDLLRKAETPNIDSLMSEGVRFTDAETVNLPATQVMNASLVTGAYPETTGVIAEHYVDEETWELKTLMDKPTRLEATTIFEVLSEEGMTSAVALGKFKLRTGARGATTVLRADVTENMDAAHYSQEFAGSAERAQGLRDNEDELWVNAGIKALEENQPNFTLIWIPNTDRTQHVWGPASDYAIGSIEHADALIGDVISKLKDLGIYEDTTIFLTADHGFTQTDPDKLLSPGWTDQANTLTALQDAGISHLSVNVGGKAVWVWLENKAKAQEAVSVLNEKDHVREIYASVEYEYVTGIDGSLAPLNVDHERAGDLLVELAGGWQYNWPNMGQHGSIYSTCKDVPLVVAGPGIQEGAVETDASIVDVAPTALYQLGVNPASLEGEGKVLEEAYVTPVVEGPQGPVGPEGPQGPAGEPAPVAGLAVAVVLSVIALVVSVYTKWEK